MFHSAATFSFQHSMTCFIWQPTAFRSSDRLPLTRCLRVFPAPVAFKIALFTSICCKALQA